MIKRLIFDLDNTLIMWEDEKNWEAAYKNLIKEFNISEKEFKKVKEVMNNYEVLQDIFIKEIMQEMINKKLNKEYSIQFLQNILDTFSECIPKEKDQRLYETLEYLCEKYELVVLTNWFTKEQEKRLKEYGILHFFSRIYGADNFMAKPSKQAYDVAVGNNKKEECIMIGDKIRNDIEGAIQNGIQAILYAPNSIECGNIEKYKIIKDLRELKLML